MLTISLDRNVRRNLRNPSLDLNLMPLCPRCGLRHLHPEDLIDNLCAVCTLEDDGRGARDDSFSETDAPDTLVNLIDFECV
jgi:hypothetical protein